MWKSGGGGAGPEKEVRGQEVTRSVMRLKKAVQTCVIDLYVGKMVALILRNENSAKHIEF